MTDAYKAWTSLPVPWQRSFEEAWVSWTAGGVGVGAAITSPDGSVISTGHNSGEPLAGTFMAHAEMNALARLSAHWHETGEPAGHTLYTTLEPCIMCAGTIRIYRIPRVAFAAYDPVWDGLHNAFSQVPGFARHPIEREQLGGPYGTLGALLPLTYLAEHYPGSDLVSFHPSAHLAFALDLIRRRTLRSLADQGASPADIAHVLWPELWQLAASDGSVRPSPTDGP